MTPHSFRAKSTLGCDEIMLYVLFLSISDTVHRFQQRYSSSFVYNYNTAYVPHLDALLVRSQNLKNGTSHPYDPTSSVLTLTPRSHPHITNLSIVFVPQGVEENFGVEDPRVVFNSKTGLFLLTYTAAQSYPNGTVIARLALATSANAKTWTRHGAIFGTGSAWSKSGAIVTKDLLHFNGATDMMIFGDSTLVGGLQLATPSPSNYSRWIARDEIYLPVRAHSWDSVLVEAGPPPMALADGNLLFVYNSAQGGFPSPKPGYS
jgi:predicted GH43/DUF377 family glycosyl hydrolase